MKLFAAEASEIIGHGWKNFIDFSMQDRVIEEFNRAVKEKRDIKILCTLHSGNSEKIPIYINALVQKDDSGTINGFVGVIERE